MRLYTDNNITSDTVNHLRRRHSVESARELFADRDDEFHFGRARSEKRILVTLDRDFISRAYLVNRHPGIIVVDTTHTDNSRLVNALLDRTFARFPTAADFYETKIMVSVTHWWRITRTGAASGRWETPLVVREPETAYAAALVPA